METQAHIYYFGTVQGVGFRYTVQRCAKDLDLKGWVKNLKDGRVEILIEGKEELIQQLIEYTNKYFDGYIKDQNISYGPAERKFKDFQITL